LARVVAVADAFDAMTTDRPYRRAKSRNEAADELVRWSGQQFDPDVVRAFLDMLSRYHTMEELDQESSQDESGIQVVSLGKRQNQ
jgi:HD-GYP domain-containing protein (c-di-GMP phosphodiesterase class II)